MKIKFSILAIICSTTLVMAQEPVTTTNQPTVQTQEHGQGQMFGFLNLDPEQTVKVNALLDADREKMSELRKKMFDDAMALKEATMDKVATLLNPEQQKLLAERRAKQAAARKKAIEARDANRALAPVK